MTQYGDGSMLCKKHIFQYERIPLNSQIYYAVIFLKVDLIIFQNPLQKLRIFTFWLFLGGGHVDDKIPKKSLFQKLWGENGHNSINIRASALKLLAFDREQTFC